MNVQPVKRMWHFTRVCYLDINVILDGFPLNLSHQIPGFSVTFTTIHYLSLFGSSQKKITKAKKVFSKWL